MLSRFNLKHGDEKFEDPPRPFMEHLIDLRTCLVRCTIVWFAATILVGIYAPEIYNQLVAPFEALREEYGVKLEILDFTTGIQLIIKVALWGGAALAFPALLFFVSRFVFPGLKPSERRMIAICLFTSTVLFIGGVFMAYGFTLRIAFKVLIQITQWLTKEPMSIIRVENYFEIALKTILAFGLAFQMPLLLLILGWLGIISADTLRAKRRHAIVAIFVIAMLLTPPDPLSQIIMAVPMCLLYELCIILISLRRTPRKTE